MEETKKLKLDVGCGGRGSMYPDFLGIDIWPVPYKKRSEAPYLKMDFLREEIPVEWLGNADEVLAMHIIEHLMPEQGLQLLTRIIKVLKKGCSAYVSCPDLRLFCEKYLEGDTEFYKKESKPGRPLWIGDTLADKMNYQMHQNDHKWAYDLESLTTLAKKAGATNVKELPKDHKWSKRPDHEIGIIITK